MVTSQKLLYHVLTNHRDGRGHKIHQQCYHSFHHIVNTWNSSSYQSLETMWVFSYSTYSKNRVVVAEDSKSRSISNRNTDHIQIKPRSHIYCPCVVIQSQLLWCHYITLSNYTITSITIILLHQITIAFHTITSDTITSAELVPNSFQKSEKCKNSLCLQRVTFGGFVGLVG